MVLHLGNLTMIEYMKELFNNIFETNIVSNSYKDKSNLLILVIVKNRK